MLLGHGGLRRALDNAKNYGLEGEILPRAWRTEGDVRYCAARNIEVMLLQLSPPSAFFATPSSSCGDERGAHAFSVGLLLSPVSRACAKWTQWWSVPIHCATLETNQRMPNSKTRKKCQLHSAVYTSFVVSRTRLKSPGTCKRYLLRRRRHGRVSFRRAQRPRAK